MKKLVIDIVEVSVGVMLVAVIVFVWAIYKVFNIHT